MLSFAIKYYLPSLGNVVVFNSGKENILHFKRASYQTQQPVCLQVSSRDRAEPSYCTARAHLLHRPSHLQLRCGPLPLLLPLAEKFAFSDFLPPPTRINQQHLLTEFPQIRERTDAWYRNETACWGFSSVCCILITRKTAQHPMPRTWHQWQMGALPYLICKDKTTFSLSGGLNL